MDDSPTIPGDKFMFHLRRKIVTPQNINYFIPFMRWNLAEIEIGAETGIIDLAWYINRC